MQVGRLGNAIDWMAYQISPSWGARRAGHRAAAQRAHTLQGRLQRRQSSRTRDTWSLTAQEWEAVERDRLRGSTWNPSQRSINTALKYGLRRLQSEAEDLYRSDPYAHAAVEGRVANEIGDGLRYKALVLPGRGITERQALKINAELEYLMEVTDKYGIDKAGRFPMSAMTRLMDRCYANYGEVFIEIGTRPSTRAPLPIAIDVQHPFRFETPPDKVNDPLIRLGIEYDIKGRVVAYHRRKAHPGDSQAGSKVVEWERIPALDERTGRPRILHVFEPLFPEQTRGIPWLAAALPKFRDVHDWEEATIVAMQMEACYAAFVKTGEGQSPYDAAARNTADVDSAGRRLENIEPGMIEYLNSDEEITFGTPQRPGNQYAPFMEQSLRTFAAVGGIPYETFAKNFTGTTFAAGRLAMLDGQIVFRLRRDTLDSQGLSKIGDEFAYEAIALGQLQPWVNLELYRTKPWLYERHEWRAEGTHFIDPSKEIKASADGVDADLLTITDTLVERGSSLEDHLARRRVEKEAFIRQDVELRALQMELEQEAGLMSEEAGEPGPGETGPRNGAGGGNNNGRANGRARQMARN